MKIINDASVLGYIAHQNNNMIPSFSIQQVQVHIDFYCGCKITQDSHGNSLFPCNQHMTWAKEHANNKILHKNCH